MRWPNSLDAEGLCQFLKPTMHVEADLHVLEVIESAKVESEQLEEVRFGRWQALPCNNLEQVSEII